MQQNSSKLVNRMDYRPPAWLVEETRLHFKLRPEATRVRSEILFRRNPAVSTLEDFKLDGKNLNLIQATINGNDFDPALLKQTNKGLTISSQALPDSEFYWTAETTINPKQNTSLDGLYMSDGMYCTQCEPEGFRRICFYPDRPDILAKFNVRIESHESVLLSNGNLVKSSYGYAEWIDPWPKPSYLFALVAGNLVSVQDSFTTMSGRKVALFIWVRKGDENRCDFAMDALKRSMKWDEENYGREYDLDTFNIVAVDDFNMGAMENKGLNIFNSQLVLASPETAVDSDYASIERVIAHEYFHNWTGNRITCRDWFQLSLKEGLTVFRDHQFARDQQSPATVRIKDAKTMRSLQYPEDAGPRAHPVRPDSFREISNFYTMTIYEKGAQIISMLHQMVGAKSYRQALDLYFERHDGQACTIEDWITVFEDALEIDLTQFKRWYSQAGTPQISWQTSYENNTLFLTLEQKTNPTPEQYKKEPLLIPIAIGLIDEGGREVVPTKILQLTQNRQTFTFENLSSLPYLSILRDYSAPVILNTERSDSDRIFALRYDQDSFNRWDAGQQLMQKSIRQQLINNAEPDHKFIDVLAEIVADPNIDPALRALMLQLPPESDVQRYLAAFDQILDPFNFFYARENLQNSIARVMSADNLEFMFHDLADQSPYSPDSKAAGQRSLRIALLRLLSRLDGGHEARQLYNSTDNMTEKIGALGALLAVNAGQKQITDFYNQWCKNRLVLNKWFTIQIIEANPSSAVDLTQKLTEHPDFDWINPNRFRAVLGAFGFGNLAGFHTPDGTGYQLVADWIIKLDAKNSQLAARCCTVFQSWKLYDHERQKLMKNQLERIKNINNLSSESAEMVDTIMQDS